MRWPIARYTDTIGPVSLLLCLVSNAIAVLPVWAVADRSSAARGPRGRSGVIASDRLQAGLHAAACRGR